MHAKILIFCCIYLTTCCAMDCDEPTIHLSNVPTLNEITCNKIAGLWPNHVSISQLDSICQDQLYRCAIQEMCDLKNEIEQDIKDCILSQVPFPWNRIPSYMRKEIRTHMQKLLAQYQWADQCIIPFNIPHHSIQALAMIEYLIAHGANYDKKVHFFSRIMSYQQPPENFACINTLLATSIAMKAIHPDDLFKALRKAYKHALIGSSQLYCSLACTLITEGLKTNIYHYLQQRPHTFSKYMSHACPQHIALIVPIIRAALYYRMPENAKAKTLHAATPYPCIHSLFDLQRVPS